MEGHGAARAFAHQLQRLIEQRGLSVRAFGKMVDPSDPERGRRRVQRHLSGEILPSRASRDSYAVALGVDPSELPLPADQEGLDAEAAFLAVSREHRSLGIRIEQLGKAMGVRS